MKTKIRNLTDYYFLLLSEADGAYWLNRRVTVLEILYLWANVAETGFDQDDVKLIRIRSAYNSGLVIQSVREDKTFWVRLLMAFFTYRKRITKTEREIYLAGANEAWTSYAKFFDPMIRFKVVDSGQKIVC